MSESEMSARTSAATDKNLLSTKAAIRGSDIPEHKKELLCKMLDNMYQHGYCDGVIWMANRAQEIIRA